MRLITATDPMASLARARESTRTPLRVGLVQHRWREAAATLRKTLLDAVGQAAGVDWIFNGWGQQDWATWGKDSHIGGAVLDRAGVKHVPSGIVNEGGGIHVDGLGTVLLTETVQLDPSRNPGLTKADVENELSRTLGGTHFVWRGQSWEIIDLPAPEVLTDHEGWVDYSYVNHLVVNGGVIACAFGDRRDADAAAILTEAYPGRDVVSVDARPLFARGGGIHCITQHQPSAGSRRNS